jgi:hypothetical protein
MILMKQAIDKYRIPNECFIFKLGKENYNGFMTSTSEGEMGVVSDVQPIVSAVANLA